MNLKTISVCSHTKFVDHIRRTSRLPFLHSLSCVRLITNLFDTYLSKLCCVFNCSSSTSTSMPSVANCWIHLPDTIDWTTSTSTENVLFLGPLVKIFVRETRCKHTLPSKCYLGWAQATTLKDITFAGYCRDRILGGQWARIRPASISAISRICMRLLLLVV